MDVKYDVILGEFREGDSPAPTSAGTIPQETVDSTAASPIVAEDNKVYLHTGSTVPSIILPDITDNAKTHSVVVDFTYTGATASSALSQLVIVQTVSQVSADWVSDVAAGFVNGSVFRLVMTWSPADSKWKVIALQLG